MKNPCLLLGMINLIPSRNLLCLSQFDLTRWCKVCRIGLVRKSEENSLLCQHSIWASATKTRRLWVRWFLCFRKVQIRLLISWNSLRNKKWWRNMIRFLLDKAKDRRLRNSLRNVPNVGIGLSFRIAISPFLGCQNLRESVKGLMKICTRISDSGWRVCQVETSLFPYCKTVLKWQWNLLRVFERTCCVRIRIFRNKNYKIVRNLQNSRNSSSVSAYSMRSFKIEENSVQSVGTSRTNSRTKTWMYARNNSKCSSMSTRASLIK